LYTHGNIDEGRASFRIFLFFTDFFVHHIVPHFVIRTDRSSRTWLPSLCSLTPPSFPVGFAQGTIFLLSLFLPIRLVPRISFGRGAHDGPRVFTRFISLRSGLLSKTYRTRPVSVVSRDQRFHRLTPCARHPHHARSVFRHPPFSGTYDVTHHRRHRPD